MPADVHLSEQEQRHRVHVDGIRVPRSCARKPHCAVTLSHAATACSHSCRWAPQLCTELSVLFSSRRHLFGCCTGVLLSSNDVDSPRHGTDPSRADRPIPALRCRACFLPPCRTITISSNVIRTDFKVAALTCPVLCNDWLQIMGGPHCRQHIGKSLHFHPARDRQFTR